MGQKKNKADVEQDISTIVDVYLTHIYTSSEKSQHAGSLLCGVMLFRSDIMMSQCKMWNDIALNRSILCGF